MGGQAMNTERIRKECVLSTFNIFQESVLNHIDHDEVCILGSAGKKEDSGDIDVGIQTSLSINQVSEILTNLNVEHKIGKGFDQIWTKFYQFDADKNPVLGCDEQQLSVQIDLMFGNIHWLKFAYWAPAPEETEFTAHHRSALLAAIIRYAEELEIEPGITQTHVINWGTGLWTKKRIKYISERGKYKGQEREKQEKSKEPIITTPEDTVKFLNDSTGKDWTINDLISPFEKLWEKADSVFDNKKLELIAKYAGDAIKHRGPDYVVPRVISDLT